MAIKYATANQLTLLGLPNEALDGVSFDVESHLEMATAQVDSYLRGRYSVPLAEPYPLEIVQATVSIATWTILMSRGFDPESGSDRLIRVRYEDTIKWLARLSDAKVNLAISVDATPGVHDGGPSVRSGGRRGRCGYGCCCSRCEGRNFYGR